MHRLVFNIDLEDLSTFIIGNVYSSDDYDEINKPMFRLSKRVQQYNN